MAAKKEAQRSVAVEDLVYNANKVVKSVLKGDCQAARQEFDTLEEDLNDAGYASAFQDTVNNMDKLVIACNVANRNGVRLGGLSARRKKRKARRSKR